jgi:hypothetical protein
MEDFSDSPLTQATSPSDFWGRRWDRPVASALKRGAYRPLRRAGVSRNVASVLTFALSGLIHEYVLYFMSLRRRSFSTDGTGSYSSYSYSYWTSPTRGRQGLFFVVNGAVLVTERLLEARRKTDGALDSLMTALGRRLPRPVRTALVLLVVLPIGHWFTDEYVETSFFADASVGFPRLTWEIVVRRQPDLSEQTLCSPGAPVTLCDD